MSDRKYPTITIARTYGAGGRTIARGISEKLGIPFYDKDFIKKTAEDSGYSVEDIEREGETLSRGSKFMNDFLNNAVSYKSSYDGIFEAERETILRLAREQDCIIVGRASNIILRSAGIPNFSIYLNASIADRIVRARELGESDEQDIERYIRKIDKRRATYYKNYTGTEMNDARNYDICLDTSTIDKDRCIDLLVDLIRSRS